MTKVGYKSFCLHHLSLNMSNYNSLLLYLDKSLGQCQSFGCVELEMSENIWTNCLSNWQILTFKTSIFWAGWHKFWLMGFFPVWTCFIFCLSSQLCNLIIIFSGKWCTIVQYSLHPIAMHLRRWRCIFQVRLKCVCHNVSQPRTDDWHFMFNWNKIL